MIDSTNLTPPWSPDHPQFGCLPRKSRPGQICPMAADRIKIIPSSEWAAAAAELGDSVRQKVWTILDQDGVGSCATEATAGAVMIAREIAGQERVLLNPWSIYWSTSGGVDGGSSIDENLEYAREHGICPESLHPRSKGWRTKPSDEAMQAALNYRIEEFYDIQSPNELVSALLLGYCVVFGSNGHAILGIQHMGSYPLILNSWGSWGDSGDGFGKWCSYNSINWGYGAFAVRVAS